MHFFIVLRIDMVFRIKIDTIIYYYHFVFGQVVSVTSGVDIRGARRPRRAR